jgi:hypothetical protein
MGAMNRVDFEAEKRLITRNGWPSYGDELIGMSLTVDVVLANIDEQTPTWSTDCDVS